MTISRTRRRGLWSAVALGCCAGILATPAEASLSFSFSDASGLAAEADFELLNPTTLQISLRNTSTNVPGGFSNSDQILTGLAWDFGPMGAAGVQITGGTVLIGATSQSVNFDTGEYGPDTDVSGEWGYSNDNGTGMLQNFITSHRPQSNAFGGMNLDGPVNIDGPSAGLISSAFSLPLGGQAAIRDEIVATLTLSEAITEMELADDLKTNLLRVEFGSDAFFITVPAPAGLAVFAATWLVGGRRRRRS